MSFCDQKLVDAFGSRLETVESIKTKFATRQPFTEEEKAYLKIVAAKTLENTEKAIYELKEELRRMAGKV
jgi:uncharacterized protein YifE (UPF0438 family)